MQSILNKIILCLLLMSVLTSCTGSKFLRNEWHNIVFKEVMFYLPPYFSPVSVSDSIAVWAFEKDTLTLSCPPASDYPISLEEQFKKEFYAYHYSRFFNKIYVDQKVAKILRDSIAILEVVPVENVDSLCQNCNVLAQLQFKNKKIPYALQMDPKLLKVDSIYTFESSTHTGYQKSIFFSKNEERISGASIQTENGQYLIKGNATFFNLKEVLLSIRHAGKRRMLEK